MNMNEKFIELTDGTRLCVGVNFATLYYAQKVNLSKYSKYKKLTDSQAMDVASKIIYIILRSNGKAVTIDEAMRLAPPDISDIQELFQEFYAKLGKLKKKRDAKQKMMKN